MEETRLGDGEAVVVPSVGRDPQYEAFADEFLDHASDGLFNAHLDRPACLDLLGDVRGLRILDAACGPGLYAEELAKRAPSSQDSTRVPNGGVGSTTSPGWRVQSSRAGTPLNGPMPMGVVVGFAASTTP